MKHGLSNCTNSITVVYRFAAVHYPINFSQSMNDPKALKERMLRYLLPVCLATLLININKFFEQTWNDPMETNSKYERVQFHY